MKRRTFIKLFSVLLAALMVLGAMPLASAESLPEKTEGYNRYYFYMPDDWKNEYTDTAGVYWWEGSDACATWPGYKANKADVEGVYYYDIPQDVTTIIWNNYFDSSTVDEGAYGCVHQTELVKADYYTDYQSDVYVDGLKSFDNMIYVLDYTKIDINEFSGNYEYTGEWFYYYGDGKYGTTKNEADAPEVYTSKTIVIDDVPPQYDESAALAEFDLNTGDYSVASGDEFCYTVMLTAPEKVLELNAVINYDSDSLKLMSSADTISPQGDSRYEIFIDTPGEIRFELSSYNGGLAYMEGRVFVNIMFKALSDKNTEISLDFESMYLGGNQYFIKNGRIYDDRVACETYISDAPTEDVNKYVKRYYFYMPEEWTSENPYTETPGVWWMQGMDVPRWPGKELVATETEGVYYYDVPGDVPHITWNNFIDRGTDEEAEIYSADYRTTNAKSDFYEAGENDIYPDGIESFDNMIFVLDLTRTNYDDYQKMTFFEGEWFYYYGNGEYGTAPEKEDALIVYNEDNVVISKVPPQGETIPEGKLTVNCGGKSYVFEYGDTFYYTARLKSDESICSISGKTGFNSDLLRIVEADNVTTYPHLSGVIHNVNKIDSAIYFNYFDLYALDLDYEKTLATYQFEVKNTGECDIEMLFTQLEDYYGDEFVDDHGKITEEGIELTEYITEEPYVGKTIIECGGKTYTFNVGDYFTYTAILESDVPVTDFFGRRQIGGSKIIETPEEERYPNIFYEEGNPDIYFTGQPRNGCDFTTPAVFIQYKLQATVECKTIIETIFVELNGYVSDKEGNLPWNYTLTEIITPEGEELPEIVLPSTDDEEPTTPSTNDEEPTTGATEPAEPEVSTPAATDPAEPETTVPTEVPVVTEPVEVPSTEVTEAPKTEATEPSEEATTTLPSTEDESTAATEDESTAPTDPESEFESGDVNKDGKLNIKDVTAIQKFLAKLLDFDEEAAVLADYNGDGSLNIKDATTIQKKLANLI